MNKEENFLLSDEFCRQFDKEWKRYNNDINNSIELVQKLERDEREKISKEESYDMTENFDYFN